MHRNLQHFSINTKGRDFAVGDIHGCFTRLEKALQTINFNPQVDRLFSTGDLIDRGEQSNEVLPWLKKPWFHAILGNHEAMVIEAAKGDPHYYADHAFHGGAWFYQLSHQEQIVIQKTFEKLPLFIEIDTPHGTVVLVHADFPYDDWHKIDPENLEQSVIQYCLWSRERYIYQYASSVQNVRAMIHGHTPVNTMLQLGNVYFIDTGGWGPNMGHFTLLELKTLTAYEGEHHSPIT